MRNEFTAVIEEGEDGWYWAFCPEVPGANGQGKSLEEVRENLAEAIDLILQVNRDEGLRNASPDARKETVVVG